MKTNHDDPYKMGYRRVTIIFTIMIRLMPIILSYNIGKNNVVLSKDNIN